MQILRIRRVHWLAAVRATYFENKQAANGGTPMLDSDGEQIDLLTQELEKMDNPDPSVATGSTTGVGQDGVAGRGGLSRERTLSLARTSGSDGGGINSAEHETLLHQHPAISGISSSTRMSFDSPNTSGRNTPTLSGGPRRAIIRAENNSTPPPSLTGSGSAKNRSLT